MASTQALPITWDFINIDDDSHMEIEQRRQIRDNWGCEWTEVSIFDWNGSQFIQATTGELEHANQAKSLFLDNTSHELRTPLTSISG